MEDIAPKAILWWIVAVDIPVFTGIFIMLNRLRCDIEHRQDILRDSIANYKLEVAKSYASINQLKDLESRVIAHLLRIETKLDNTALKAHALHLLSPNQPNQGD